MKNLSPTLREKNRYIAFEVISKKQLNIKGVKEGLEKEILGFLGALELAKSSFKLINFQKNKGIIKVQRKYLNKIKTALILINNIQDNKVMIKNKYVSGILKKAKLNLK
jgi:ribonuclease P/MRP protein subunit POP5